MSILVVGVSHNSAPVQLLEQLAIDHDGLHKLVQDVAHTEHVSEATAIATCNRLEIYSEVDRFHGSVEQLSRLLVGRAGVRVEDVLPHLYVHYDDGAVSRLFKVAAGLDSMAVGEGQILGQTRSALQLGRTCPIGPDGREVGLDVHVAHPLHLNVHRDISERHVEGHGDELTDHLLDVGESPRLRHAVDARDGDRPPLALSGCQCRVCRAHRTSRSALGMLR